MGHHIDRGAVKIIEIIGISPESFEDAVQQGVSKASDSLSGITGTEIIGFTTKVLDGKVVEYRADMKLAFVVK